MATPKKINSKTMSLFDDKSRQEGANFNNKVTIRTSSGTIIGYLTDPFKWNMSASWKGMFEGFGKFSVIQKGFEVVGEQVFNQGIFTRKIYKGNAYVELPLKFRVTDYNGTGTVMSYSKTLANSMLPNASKLNTAKLFKSFNPFDGNGGEAESKAERATDLVGGVIAGGAGAIINQFQEGADPERFLDDQERALNGHVGGVGITIGNVFSNVSMVIESGSVTYSNAQVKNSEGVTVGPLYGDFEIKASARSVKPKGGSGVNGTPGFTNVTVNK